jgi:hypothetical protein
MTRRRDRIGSVTWRSGTRHTVMVSLTIGFAAAIALTLPVCSQAAFAQSGAAYPGTLPDTSITPATGGTPEVSAPSSHGGKTSTVNVPDEDAPDTTAPAPAHKKAIAVHHHAVHHKTKAVAASPPPQVEPQSGKATIKTDSWAYSRPSKSGKRIEPMHAGKFVVVTGLTSSYVRVQLKNGSTGYVPASAVDLTRPADKVFQLTTDAPVLSQPSRYGKKISEVHKGHDVHVVGLALNYMKIRMRDGVEGFIPVSALE